MSNKLKRTLAVIFAAALVFGLAATLPVAADDYYYYSVFDAETDAGATLITANHSDEIIETTEKVNESSTKLLKVTRTDVNGNMALTWRGDFTQYAADSVGVRVWVAGDAAANLLRNTAQGGVTLGFSFVDESGTRTVLFDGAWGGAAADITEDGGWYTIMWSSKRFRAGSFNTGNYKVWSDNNNSNAIDATVLQNLESIHLAFGRIGNNTVAFTDYMGVSLYADDLQLILNEAPTPPAPADEGSLTLDLNNSAIDVSVGQTDKSVNAPTTEVVANGAEVTLTAQTAGNEFLFWAEDGKIRNETPQYSFLMNGARNVNAVFAPATGSVVVYRNDTPNTKQVVATKTCETAEDFTAHLAESATMYDKTFTGWDKSVEEIQALIGSEQVIYVNPVYEDNSGFYNVTVENGRIDDTMTLIGYKFGTKLNITTDLEGFSYWTDDTGAVLSTSATFIYTVTNRDAVLTAVANATPAASSTLTVEYDGDLMKIYHSFYLPDDCTLIDAGLIYAKSLLNTEPVLADVDGTTVKATHLGAAGGNAQTVMNTITSASGVTLRGYVIYEIGGETVTIYSATDNGGV